MKLSTKSRYGTRLLLDLACHGKEGPVHAGDISKRLHVSVKYLEQIIRILKKSKLVSSSRGAMGGYMLARNPEEITLGEIVRLFETQKDLVACISHPEKCILSKDCSARLAWTEATDALYQKLDTITIAVMNKGA